MNEQLRIPADIYQQIMDTIGALPAESGGVFSLNGCTAAGFYFDPASGSGKRFYQPTSGRITGIVNGWLAAGQQFGGFIHSHRPFHTRLSPMDVVTAERTMAMNGLKVLYMGIVCQGTLYFYRLTAVPGEDHAALEACGYTICAEGRKICPDD